MGLSDVTNGAGISSLDVCGAAVDAPRPRHVCKHFWRTGACAYAERCKFAHDCQRPPEPLPDAPRARRPNGRGVVRNDARCNILRRFVWERFAVLQDSASPASLHVLDVAGGKGELAFQCLNLWRRVGRATVVDPRPLELKRFRTQLACGFFTRSAHLNPHNQAGELDDSEPSEAGCAPGSLAVLFRPELWLRDDSAAREYLQRQRAISFEDAFARNLVESAAWDWARHGRGHEDEIGDKRERSNQDAREAAVDLSLPGTAEPVSLDGARAVLESVDLILAMHPDQAAEHAIDAALRLRKPFFVVPCCTYAQEFPWRRQAADRTKRVTTYGELLDYLQAKGEEPVWEHTNEGDKRLVGTRQTIHRDVLGFEGKNVVLWRTEY